MNCLNITYIVTPIPSSSFKDLNFLVLLKIGGISNIKKIMIFIDSVKKGITLGKYLQSFLLDNLKNRGKKIIISFLSMLETKTKTD